MNPKTRSKLIYIACIAIGLFASFLASGGLIGLALVFFGIYGLVSKKSPKQLNYKRGAILYIIFALVFIGLAFIFVFSQI